MEAFYTQISAFGFPFAMKDWAICNGATVLVKQNETVYALMGNFFGGDYDKTYLLPDLRGRTPMGIDTPPPNPFPGPLPPPPTDGFSLGARSGVETVTLRFDNLPGHTHAASGSATVTAPGQVTLQANSADADTGDPADGAPAALSFSPPYAPSTMPGGASVEGVDIVAAADFSAGGTSSAVPAGPPAPVPVRSPYQAVNYQICMNGDWPRRY